MKESLKATSHQIDKHYPGIVTLCKQISLVRKRTFRGGWINAFACTIWHKSDVFMMTF